MVRTRDIIIVILVIVIVLVAAYLLQPHIRDKYVYNYAVSHDSLVNCEYLSNFSLMFECAQIVSKNANLSIEDCSFKNTLIREPCFFESGNKSDPDFCNYFTLPEIKSKCLSLSE